MKIYSKNVNVYQAALDRIRYLFDEFENVVVGFSGGKDSTVTLNLALEIAREKNRLPLSVMFVDQEAEWQGTIDYVELVFKNKDIKPYWFQMPMVITNNASSYERYSYCWDETKEDKWIHKKNDISIKENIYGTDRFHDLFEKIFKVEFPDTASCYLAGVRTEESPKRHVALTDNLTYKWITWGKKLNETKGHYTFYPIYDWSYTDVWKYIHDNGIAYNKVYDEMYRHGVNVRDMRISNLHHETAIQNLMLVQEIEPETWLKIADRIDGANTIKHIKTNSFVCPKDLPYMFDKWEDYALHLAKNIIQEDNHREMLYKQIEKSKEVYAGNDMVEQAFWKAIINTILSSDWDFTKFKNWEISGPAYSYRKYMKGKREKRMLRDTKYFSTEQLNNLMQDINELN